MILMFTLSMPNVGSWNGKWTSAENLYAMVQNFGASKKRVEQAQKILDGGGYYYNFGDGWGASVDVRAVNAKEANKARRASKGFCGYDWMVREIIADGRIKTLQERNEEREKQADNS